jgi:hypothetical protein
MKDLKSASFLLQEGEPEDFHFRGAIRLDNLTIRHVRCKIWLPEAPEGKVILRLYPNLKQLRQLSGKFEASLNGQQRRPDGRPAARIAARRIHLQRSSSRLWSRTLGDHVIQCEPVDLTIESVLGGSRSRRSPANIVLWITPNRYLSPVMSVERSYTGDVTYRRHHRVALSLERDLKLTFDEHFGFGGRRHAEDEGRGHLVVTTLLDHRAAATPEFARVFLPKVDDLLLVASIGTGIKTVCVGWQMDSNTIARHFRREIAMPNMNAPSVRGELVPQTDLATFLRQAFRELWKCDSGGSIRQAMRVLVPGQQRTLESSFVALFSALESLVLAFRRRQELEFVLKEDEWDDLSKHLRKCIKSWSGLEKEQRQCLYAKLGELNRIPFQVALNRFWTTYGVLCEDLWPVFESKGGIDLSTIRNRIVHGDVRPDGSHFALSVALEHLEWTVGRAILAAVRWPLERTSIHPQRLEQHATGIAELAEARATLSRMWPKP